MVPYKPIERISMPFLSTLFALGLCQLDVSEQPGVERHLVPLNASAANVQAQLATAKSGLMLRQLYCPYQGGGLCPGMQFNRSRANEQGGFGVLRTNSAVGAVVVIQVGRAVQMEQVAGQVHSVVTTDTVLKMAVSVVKEVEAVTLDIAVFSTLACQNVVLIQSASRL